ncbi:hypothetical protein LCGC14_1584950 [marine sediment metagenome]|uniref:Aminoglycoside phosphotransferase domain-containing protein n=1 Tax=marine sediment metagenome TaxID=412755 RepID=A0A0F9IFY5_9ZZZZ
MEEKFTKIFFQNIIFGRTQPNTEIKNLNIESFYDEPGLHWSNPGVKKVNLETNRGKIELIIKILHERSKREVLIYRFLSKHPNFPIPNVYYTEYNENKRIYVVITEFGGSIGEIPFKEQAIKYCGILLADIHSYFWNNSDALPKLFHSYNLYKNRYKFKKNALNFFNNLKSNEIKVFEKVYPNIHSLRKNIESLDKEFFKYEPYTKWTLIHGSFHPPEIIAKPGENKTEITPIGVDWEGSRIGHPGEDIAGITGQIPSSGEPHYMKSMIDSYMEVMNNNEAFIDRKALEKEIILENIIQKIKLIPFMWGKYLEVRNDSKFSNWVNYFENSFTKNTDSALNDMQTYDF